MGLVCCISSHRSLHCIVDYLSFISCGDNTGIQITWLICSIFAALKISIIHSNAQSSPSSKQPTHDLQTQRSLFKYYTSHRSQGIKSERRHHDFRQQFKAPSSRSLLRLRPPFPPSLPHLHLPPLSLPPAERVKRDSIDDCFDSSFEDTTSVGSQSTADCQTLASTIAGGGTCQLLYDDFRIIATYGTCAFGTSADHCGTTIGNQDIIDLIIRSVEKFSWNGLIGAKGTVICQGWT